jgi:Ser/Thr protein kinase RdoA (MazF antagonist)
LTLHQLTSFEDTATLLKLLNTEYPICGQTLNQHRNLGGIVYFVQSATQRYVFKIFRAINTENALQSIRILTYLYEEGYPAVTIIPTVSVEDHLVLHCPEGECIGVLYPFIEGEEIDGISRENAAALGEQVAHLHRLMLSQKAPRLLHRGKEFYVDRFIQMLERDHYDPVRTREFAEYGNTLWSNLAPLPQGFCHGDLHTGNMILNNSGFVLFDFDISSSAFPVIDVATLCDETHFNNFDEAGYDKTILAFDAFYQGYSLVRSLSDAEIRGIFDFIPVRHYELFATILLTHNETIRVPGIDEQYHWMMRWRELCAKKR